MTQSPCMSGRKVIYSDVEKITADNVVDVLNKAIGTHTENAGQIDYLYNYYRGIQPVFQRKKEVWHLIKNIELSWKLSNLDRLIWQKDWLASTC